MNKASVSNSEIHGNLKVGDENNYIINLPPVDPTIIARFLKKIEALSTSDEDFQWFIERLDFFTAQKKNIPVIGLEQKLKNGGRADLIDVAIERKDSIAKRLYKSQLTPRRQGVFVYILQKISFSFEEKIRPLMKNGVDDEVIDRIILHGIVDEIYREIMAEDPTIDQAAISGMIYFLTGKCHLIWDKKKC